MKFCRTILSAKLGVEPDDETQLLFKQIKAAITSKPQRPLLQTHIVNLPNIIYLQVKQHLLDVQAELQTRQQSSLSLADSAGLWGVGKSRLALAAVVNKSTHFGMAYGLCHWQGYNQKIFPFETPQVEAQSDIRTTPPSQLITLSQKEMPPSSIISSIF